MNAPLRDDRAEQSPPTSDWDPGLVFEEYWSELSADKVIDPDRWLGARGGDPALSSQLQVLSDLKSSGPEIAAQLAASAAGHATDVRPLSTSLPKPVAGRTACFQPGELVDGRLRVLAELGKGGMGEVYVAWHPALEREVAIKVLPSDQAQDEEAVRRFKKSIALHAQAGGHPNVVGVTDAGQHNGHMYLVMEYVAGIDLQKLSHSRRPIPWREVCDWVLQAARGLEHAHRNKLVHRDIKPANLIRASDGTIKLLDWGLARGDKSSGADPGATKEFVGRR
jgi:hypothetical protein